MKQIQVDVVALMNKKFCFAPALPYKKYIVDKLFLRYTYIRALLTLKKDYFKSRCVFTKKHPRGGEHHGKEAQEGRSKKEGRSKTKGEEGKEKVSPIVFKLV